MCMSCHKQVQLEEVRGSHVREFPHMQSSKYTKSTLPSSRKIALVQRRRHTGFLGSPCYTSFTGLCADASLGTVSAQTSHDCRGLVCVWWRPWVSGRAAPRPQYNYRTGSEETVVVDREWLQAMSSRIHRHKTLWSHCKHSLMKHPEMRVASRVTRGR
jgi:hypothetical protein